MAKELYLYGSIYSYSAEALISQIEEHMGEPVTIAVNTPGGGVLAAWGVAKKMRDHGNVTMSVHGMAASMGGFLLCFAKKTEALDVSRIMIHRADMQTDNEDDKALLNSINKDLRAILEKTIDVEEFAKITGYTLDDVFNPDKRVDVWITGKEAKKIKLVQKVITLSPQEAEAFYKIHDIAAKADISDSTPISNKKVMTIDEIKAKHPETYNAIFKAGIESERDRVGAHMAFVDIDPEAVAKGIKEGTVLTATAMAEFSRKAMNVQAVKNIEKDSTGAVVPGATTPESAKTAKEAEMATFEASLDKKLSIK